MSLPATLTGYLTGAMDPDEAVVLEAQAAGDPDLQAQIDAQREAGPRRGRAPKLLLAYCPTCGAGVGIYCRSSTGKVLANGHRARRERAGLEAAKSGPGPSARPPTDSADELVSAIKRAARAGRGIRLSSTECSMLIDAIVRREKALQGAPSPEAVSGAARVPATPPDAISAPMATMRLLLTARERWKSEGVIVVTPPIAASHGEPWRAMIVNYLGDYSANFSAPTEEALYQTLIRMAQ
jgi:hypothetical protein